jgi:hypothetical protein
MTLSGQSKRIMLTKVAEESQRAIGIQASANAVLFAVFDNSAKFR